MNLIDVTNFVGLTNIEQSSKDQVAATVPIQKEKRKVLYTWEAQSRTNVKSINQKTLRTFMIIGAVVALLLVAMQEFVLILGILSLIFISYMLSQIPAEHVKYEITNQGINYVDKFYKWSDLRHFFFTKQQDLEILAVDVKAGIPGRLFLTVGSEDKAQAKKILEKYLTFLEEEPKTFMDKAYDSVSDRLQLES